MSSRASASVQPSLLIVLCVALPIFLLDPSCRRHHGRRLVRVVMQSCGSGRTWRVPGHPLPMSLELVDAAPRWNLEPRKVVTPEQRARNLVWIADGRAGRVRIDDESVEDGVHTVYSPPGPPGTRPRMRTAPAVMVAPDTPVEDLDEFVAEQVPADEGMTMTETWKEQAKVAT